MLRYLRLAALVETISVVGLLINLATVHNAAVTSLIGPLHGCAYLITVVIAFATARTGRRPAAWPSLIPAVGGWLALRALTNPERRPHAASERPHRD